MLIELRSLPSYRACPSRDTLLMNNTNIVLGNSDSVRWKASMRQRPPGAFIALLAAGVLAIVVNSSAVAGLAIDLVRSTDRSSSATTITSPALTTGSANELLLAFIATDGNGSTMTVTGVTGAGLTWSLVQRANAQRGTAEIWRTFAPTVLSNATVTASLAQKTAASITVITFTGADTSGPHGSGAIGRSAGASAASGAPSASLLTTRANSWVFGVGNDWDRAIARTPGSNQTIVHQYLATVGDTYWVQRQNNPSPMVGMQVFINDTQPTTDRYNLSIVEVLPAVGSVPVYNIIGAIAPATLGAGAAMSLSQGGTVLASTTVTGSGSYSFAGVPNGTYTVTPSKTGVVFTPGSQAVTINGTDALNINFTAASAPTWSISGAISPSALGAGAMVSLSGPASATTAADTSGSYSFTGLLNGTYMVTPNKSGVTFTPGNQTVIVNGSNAVGINFTAQSLPPPVGNYPDLSDMIPTAQISVVGSGTGRQLQYTHDTFNGGTGPLEILPVYNSASGNYQGYQHIYSFSASGSATLVQTIPVAGAFVFDAAHGHFHFPFASYGLYPSNPDGTIGSPAIAVSAKVGFCIDDSFILNTNPPLPNAGAFGSFPGPFGQFGSCTDPTSLRGLSISGVDEYDQTDEGQSITISPTLSGTFWLRAIVDPFNYFAESDKTNNETDVQLVIGANNSVTVLQTVAPKLTQPPGIVLTSPTGGAVSGTVQLSASTAASGSVQYLVDGLPFGAPVSNAPYPLAWNTTGVPNGTHWLAAQVSDSTGRVGTSAVTSVTVNNSTTIPPVVTITDPDAGSTVSAVVTIAATAAAQVGVPSVQFYVDNSALGSPIAAPPYMTLWDTQTVTGGTHILTASAVDQSGLTGSAAPVAVIVDNSHPANPIGMDATVFQDGSGTLQTPAFSTTTNSDLIVAFVAYDGPANGTQTATVSSGGGLVWQLAKRGNSQLGTAEVWVAKATDFLSSVTVTSQPGTGGYHGSLTVIAFTNASGVGVVGAAGALTGAPSIYLPGISDGNWVFAVGNDWDNPIARTPVSGQVLVHQKVDTQVGDTYWVQSTAAPSPVGGIVTIQDTAPTTDRWNYAAVEIVATRQ